ncbi:hypothetical protein GGR58DRAFT_508688 [Xylaria digitata]|nr:hypothetical protein GGR58DRAFT_508688 [Xylaria digitata]
MLALRHFIYPDPVQAGLLGSITIPIAHFTGNPLAPAVAASLLAYLIGVFKRCHVELWERLMEPHELPLLEQLRRLESGVHQECKKSVYNHLINIQGMLRVLVGHLRFFIYPLDLRLLVYINATANVSIGTLPRGSYGSSYNFTIALPVARTTTPGGIPFLELASVRYTRSSPYDIPLTPTPKAHHGHPQTIPWNLLSLSSVVLFDVVRLPTPPASAKPCPVTTVAGLPAVIFTSASRVQQHRRLEHIIPVNPANDTDSG